MDRLVVSTVVYLPRETVFDFLVDFPRYARYSEYLTAVDQSGDGGPGTRYRLRFEWWRVGYTARSRVTGVERPERIEWRLTRHLDAAGRWRTEPVADLPADAPPDATDATRVVFEVSFDPDSATSEAVDLPRLLPLDAVIERARPLVVDEAERVVSRVVADLEGRERDVSLTVRRERTDGAD